MCIRDSVELGAGIRMGDRNLNGFVIELLGEVDGLADALVRFTGKADDKVSVNHEAQLTAVFREALGHLDGRALLDVLENLRIARFVADNQQPATRLLHRFERVVVRCYARRAGPVSYTHLDVYKRQC